jgi:hypothetical protein
MFALIDDYYLVYEVVVHGKPQKLIYDPHTHLPCTQEALEKLQKIIEATALIPDSEKIKPGPPPFTEDGPEYEPKEFQSRSARIGFVYLMRNSRNNLWKIGFSNKPKVREKTLQAEEPEVELHAYFPASMLNEKHLHSMLKKKRVRGEWFKLNESDIQSAVGYLKGLPTLNQKIGDS